MGLAKFTLQLDATKGWLIVNGQDISAFVSEVTVHKDARGIPELFLRCVGEAAVQGEGVVRVMSNEDPDLGAVVGTFLDNIDPAQLEAAALANLGMGDNGTAAILEQLKKYARGE